MYTLTNFGFRSPHAFSLELVAYSNLKKTIFSESLTCLYLQWHPNLHRLLAKPQLLPPPTSSWTPRLSLLKAVAVLKQVRHDTGICNKATAILNNIVNDVFEHIATETSSRLHVKELAEALLLDYLIPRNPNLCTSCTQVFMFRILVNRSDFSRSSYTLSFYTPLYNLCLI